MLNRKASLRSQLIVASLILAAALVAFACFDQSKKAALHRLAEESEAIVVSQPVPNATVTSPLEITGKARGQWYFEAAFSVELVDANGVRMAADPVTAQGDWMTEAYVPFTCSLQFSKAATPTGILILHKANPSGLPERDEQLAIPVRFK